MRLSEIRFLKNINQLSLAKETKISQPRLSDFERGKIALREDEFAALQKAIGCKIDPVIVKEKWRRK